MPLYQPLGGGGGLSEDTVIPIVDARIQAYLDGNSNPTDPVPTYREALLATSPSVLYGMDDADQTPKYPPFLMADASGNGKNGTHNAANFDLPYPILEQPSLIHDGHDNGGSARYGGLANSRSEGPFTDPIWAPAQDWSLLMRVKPNTDDQGQMVLVGCSESWELHQWGGGFHFGLYQGGGTWGGFNIAPQAGAIVAGQEYSLAVTYNNTTQKITAYVDGVECSSTIWGLTDRGGRWFHIGSSTITGAAGFDGWLDELAYWAGTVLDTEIPYLHALTD